MKRKKNFKFISTFILELILFWIIFFINGYVWVNGLDFVSDILQFILVVGMIIIIVSAILIISEFSKSNSKSRLKKIGLVIIFVFLHTLLYDNFVEMEIKTVGAFSISNIEVIGDRYYFHIKNSDNSDTVKIECPKDIYGELIIDHKVLYSFTYRWLIYNDNKGVLEGNINTTDYIDNRQKLLN